MENKFIVSSSPHIRSNEDTSYIMKQVLLALSPAALAALYYFRASALFVMFFCILGTVGSEFLYQKIMKQKSTIGDYSAVVTGLLLAFNVPASLPWWMCILGGVFAIIVVKMVFGGLGNNFVNPALAGRAFLLASFPVAMTAWTKTGVIWVSSGSLDAVSTATQRQDLGSRPDSVRIGVPGGGKTPATGTAYVTWPLGRTAVCPGWVFFLLFKAAPMAHGGSPARG